MKPPVLLASQTRWECPNCNAVDLTYEAQPHTRFHPCAGLAGLTAPMVREGTRCKITAHEREDYIGDEDVQYDGNGRPIMSVEVEREDGNDVAVYAPTAHVRVG